jgi:hypothetical protein
MLIKGELRMVEPQIIIGIPGLWKNKKELVQEVVTKSGGYLLAGNIIHNASRNVGFEIDVYEHEQSLTEAFSYASGGRLKSELLTKIDQHTYTVYVITKVKDFKTVKEIIDVGMGLLNAGGIAIKIETVGVAYSKEEWAEIVENKEYFPIYSHFVTLIGDEERYFSCGMQSFNLPDVIISVQIDPEVATDIINDFNLYNLTEKPNLKDGETFSIAKGSPVYKLSLLNDFRYEEDDIFYNPCGLWVLKPLSRFRKIIKRIGLL